MTTEPRLAPLCQRARGLVALLGEQPLPCPDEADAVDVLDAAIDQIEVAIGKCATRVQDTLQLLSGMAARDFSRTLDVSGDGSVFDALAASANMLSEALHESQAA